MGFISDNRRLCASLRHDNTDTGTRWLERSAVVSRISNFIRADGMIRTRRKLLEAIDSVCQLEIYWRISEKLNGVENCQMTTDLRPSLSPRLLKLEEK
ncbi:hypothetical protein AVEN_63143-1 [Araneus ventricosus]|uniref:Uncharacterized protein n=1 Tax=Araneus ventricosus TaxID=182803 RepID=A0A4Y2B0E1_ARAVE|nr:hypothetical protein AVEN_63143-1 [Araneus ventricosus]